MQSAQQGGAEQGAYQQANAQTDAGNSPIDEMQLAQEAGMSAVPMTAQDVCAQRTVTLSDHEGMSRAQKVEFAVDRASVCRIQNVVISAPSREAARLQRAIIAQGVAEEAISLQQASASDATVQMTFGGIATSNEQYAQMFNPQYAAANANRFAPASASDASPGYPPSNAPAADPAAPSVEPSTAAPEAPSATPNMNDSVTPSDPAAPQATDPGMASPQ